MIEPQMVPLYQWTCDSCGNRIQSPGEGLLEWIISKGKIYGYRIVHDPQCKYQPKELTKKEVADSIKLEELTDSKGLVRLLDILERKDHLDRTEMVDIIRRIHVRHYEEARQYWRRALQDRVIENVDKRSNYFPEFSLSIIQKYGNNG